uniref:hypothetical protein n=1 Tax=Rhizobium meliloti TaxID=382 RepID=UPI0018676DD8|nr:hypothetical protein [Sinorhizobium meliloti]
MGLHMALKTTKFRALTFTILIEEVDDRAPNGQLICYLASVYKLADAGGSRQLLRRSRVPGAAATLQKEIERDGLRAFDRLMVRDT